jgi:hypothetical protein
MIPQELKRRMQAATKSQLQEMIQYGFWTTNPETRQRYISHRPKLSDINCGNCLFWAEMVVYGPPPKRTRKTPCPVTPLPFPVTPEPFPGAEARWVSEREDPDSPFYNYPAHAAVCYKGRYYDAECPKGVSDPWDLPIGQREIRIYGVMFVPGYRTLSCPK